MPIERCPYEPEKIGKDVPMGMHHCPTCGCMVIAGIGHGPCTDDECEFYDEEADRAMAAHLADLQAQAVDEGWAEGSLPGDPF